MKRFLKNWFIINTLCLITLFAGRIFFIIIDRMRHHFSSETNGYICLFLLILFFAIAVTAFELE